MFGQQSKVTFGPATHADLNFFCRTVEGNFPVVKCGVCRIWNSVHPGLGSLPRMWVLEELCLLCNLLVCCWRTRGIATSIGHSKGDRFYQAKLVLLKWEWLRSLAVRLRDPQAQTGRCLDCTNHSRERTSYLPPGGVENDPTGLALFLSARSADETQQICLARFLDKKAWGEAADLGTCGKSLWNVSTIMCANELPKWSGGHCFAVCGSRAHLSTSKGFVSGHLRSQDFWCCREWSVLWRAVIAFCRHGCRPRSNYTTQNERPLTPLIQNTVQYVYEDLPSKFNNQHAHPPATLRSFDARYERESLLQNLPIEDSGSG